MIYFKKITICNINRFVRKGAFKLQNATADVTKEIKKGYYVIIDTVGLTNEHLILHCGQQYPKLIIDMLYFIVLGAG